MKSPFLDFVHRELWRWGLGPHPSPAPACQLWVGAAWTLSSGPPAQREGTRLTSEGFVRSK